MSDSRKCSRIGCNERFSLVLRGGRNSDKAMAGRQRTYHKGRRYCSDTCRKLASKARLQSSPKRAEKSRPATRVLSTVAAVASTLDISMGYEGQKSGRAPLQMNFGGYTVVPDPEWPKMYRVRRPDGSLTDMVNLIRAGDAARALAESEQATRRRSTRTLPHHAFSAR